MRWVAQLYTTCGITCHLRELRMVAYSDAMHMHGFYYLTASLVWSTKLL
jgi:hypothetical protein